MGRRSRYSPEVGERAVGRVAETEAEHPSQWAAIGAIASKIGCTPETLRKWVRQAEIDSGRRGGFTTAERERSGGRASAGFTAHARSGASCGGGGRGRTLHGEAPDA